MHKVEIAGRSIGPGFPPYLIAEAGINHGGDVELAKRLISLAADAGAEAVKLQAYVTEKFIAKDSPFFSVLNDARLSRDEILILAEHAKKAGVVLFASVFDEESADLLHSVDAPAFKIASGDLTHDPLLRHVAAKGKPIILSTGGSTMGEIDHALAVIDAVDGAPPVVLLHCVSNYPTRPEDANLRSMDTMADQFGRHVGFSDHTLDGYAAIAAVALGASVIEKHFTYDRNADGPDHALSVDPEQLAWVLEGITTAWKARGAKRKAPVEDADFIVQIRRSVAAAVPIPAGTKITADMIAVKRPATGIPARDFDQVPGRIAKNDIAEDAPIKWEDLSH